MQCRSWGESAGIAAEGPGAAGCGQLLEAEKGKNKQILPQNLQRKECRSVNILNLAQ